MSQTELTLHQIEKLIKAVNEWFDAQLNEITLDLKSEQLTSEIFSAVGYLDRMFALCIDLLARRSSSTRVTKLLRGIEALDARLEDLEFPRYQVSLALIRYGQRPVTELEDYLSAIIKELVTDDDKVILRAVRAAYALLKEDSSEFHAYAKILFDAVVACVFAQRTTCINQAMNLLANLPTAAWARHLDQTTLLLLDTTLSNLASRLDYNREGSTGVDFDELTPTLRLRACELSYALAHTAKGRSPAAQRWLDAVREDPLPEVRLGRFQRVVKEADIS